MAVVTFLEWGGFSFLFKLLMAILAVLVIGILQLHGPAFLSIFSMTGTALLHRITLFPRHFLAVFSLMVAVRTGYLVILIVFLVVEFYRSFLIFRIAVLNQYFFGNIRRR